MQKDLITKLHRTFEDSVHNEDGVEFWYARDLQRLLDYTQWRNFELVIEKAKTACKNSNNEVSDHFADVSKVIEAGKGALHEVSDYRLTRYACYLIAQNGDSRKTEIAFAQTYFAIQTRKQEILEKRFEEAERISARERLTESEKLLAGIAFERGVDGEGFARIKSRGDQVLFGGNTTSQMKQRLKIPEKRALADFLPEVTISAKQLANAISSHNINDKNLKGEASISTEHQASNREVRGALTRAGIYPEKLPAAEDLKKVASRLKAEQKQLPKHSKKLKKG